MALVLVFSIIIDIFTLKKNSFKIGRIISHAGFGFLILSIGLNLNLSVERDINLKVGESYKFLDYELIFNDIIEKKEKNYKAIVGNFALKNQDKKNTFLNPEIRVYDQPNIMTSEASISSSFFSDYYLTMSYIPKNEYFNIRFQHKPFMIWIWISFIFISIGGMFSFFKRNE